MKTIQVYDYSVKVGARIGKSKKTKCYVDPCNGSKVILISTDPIKEAMSEVSDKMVHFRGVEYVARGVYRMERLVVQQSLFPRLNVQAIDLYRALRKCSQSGQCTNYTTTYRTLAPIGVDFPKAWEEIEHILGWVSNWSYDIRFEISPRNVSADAQGNLILLDVFYIR